MITKLAAAAVAVLTAPIADADPRCDDVDVVGMVARVRMSLRASTFR